MGPTTDDTYEDLDNLGGEFKPDTGGILDPIDVLRDGEYEFEILAAVLGNSQQTPPQRIVELQLRLLPGVRRVKHAYWLSDIQGANKFAADCMTLGLDADRWGTPQRPLSQEIPKACRMLAGKRFSAYKGSWIGKNDNKQRHKLSINVLLSSTGNGKPQHGTVPASAAAPPSLAGQTAGPSPTDDPNACPF